MPTCTDDSQDQAQHLESLVTGPDLLCTFPSYGTSPAAYCRAQVCLFQLLVSSQDYLNLLSELSFYSC